MNRQEHLDWCKRRALAYLPDAPREAFASMMSDIRKHPELVDHIGVKLGARMMLIPGWKDNREEVRRFIEGFN